MSKETKYEKPFDVAGILGGLTLTVFVLLIQTPLEDPLIDNNLELYKELMIGGMGLVSSLFIIAVIGLKIINIERDFEEENILERPLFKKFTTLTFNVIYEAGLIGLLVLFPLLVFPFSYAFSIIIIIIEISWGIVWIYTWYKYKRKTKYFDKR